LQKEYDLSNEPNRANISATALSTRLKKKKDKGFIAHDNYSITYSTRFFCFNIGFANKVPEKEKKHACCYPSPRRLIIPGGHI
jgi:hypothetical protein